MNPTKLIVYCSPSTPLDIEESFVPKLSDELPVKFKKVDSVEDLLLFTNIYTTDIIIIDVETIYKTNGATALDMVRTLATVAAIKNAKSFIVAAVGIDTDIKLIKEIKTISDIKSIGPRGGDFSYEEVRDAVKDYLDGKYHTPTRIKEKLKNCNCQKKSSSIELTPRQDQIFTLVTTRGASNKIIAKMLQISESTVKLHMSAIFKKYGVKNRTQLAVFVRPHAEV